MYLDCSGVTTENSATCVLFLIKCGDSVALVTLTATLLSIIVDLEWEISRLAISVKFSNGITVPVVLYFEGWWTKAVIAFVVLSVIVRASSVKSSWGFAVISLEAILIGIVKGGKCKRPCVVLMTTLLFLIKCFPMISPVYFFITTNCSANMLSLITKLKVAKSNGFSNRPFATCRYKLKGSSIWRNLVGSFCFKVSKSFWVNELTKAPESNKASTVKLFSKSRDAYNFPCFCFWTTVEVNGTCNSWSVHLSSTFPQIVGLLSWEVEW